jgi:hypothetical protein
VSEPAEPDIFARLRGWVRDHSGAVRDSLTLLLFAALLEAFRRTARSRFPLQTDTLRTLPNRAEVREALREFPGGLMAHLPGIDPEDWLGAGGALGDR